MRYPPSVYKSSFAVHLFIPFEIIELILFMWSSFLVVLILLLYSCFRFKILTYIILYYIKFVSVELIQRRKFNFNFKIKSKEILNDWRKFYKHLRLASCLFKFLGCKFSMSCIRWQMKIKLWNSIYNNLSLYYFKNFKWIYFTSNFIFLNFKYNLLNKIEIKFRSDNFQFWKSEINVFKSSQVNSDPKSSRANPKWRLTQI